MKNRISGADGDDVEVVFRPDEDISERVICLMLGSISWKSYPWMRSFSCSAAAIARRI